MTISRAAVRRPVSFHGKAFGIAPQCAVGSIPGLCCVLFSGQSFHKLRLVLLLERQAPRLVLLIGMLAMMRFTPHHITVSVIFNAVYDSRCLAVA